MTMEEFYQGKKVFITGHCGFKGTWLSKLLIDKGAIIKGYSLPPETNPNLFMLSKVQDYMETVIGDVRDFDNLKKHYDCFNPDVVFHLAAQPIVLKGYKSPCYTYETNVMGTVNLLECIRLAKNPPVSVIIITTDKVYKHNEETFGYSENNALGGFDPYSCSKSCADLITQSYKKSFFDARQIPVSVMRAGNVIGGGDFAANRIIPDCVRAAIKKEVIAVRNPHSIRPYQYVLEPLLVYMLLAMRQSEAFDLSGCYNIGPNEENSVTTEALVSSFCKIWGNGQTWKQVCFHGPTETEVLKLNSSKIRNALGFFSVWNVDNAIRETIKWYKEYAQAGNISSLMDEQIAAFQTIFVSS